MSQPQTTQEAWLELERAVKEAWAATGVYEFTCRMLGWLLRLIGRCET